VENTPGIKRSADPESGSIAEVASKKASKGGSKRKKT